MSNKYQQGKVGHFGEGKEPKVKRNSELEQDIRKLQDRLARMLDHVVTTGHARIFLERPIRDNQDALEMLATAYSAFEPHGPLRLKEAEQVIAEAMNGLWSHVAYFETALGLKDPPEIIALDREAG